MKIYYLIKNLIEKYINVNQEFLITFLLSIILFAEFYSSQLIPESLFYESSPVSGRARQG